ncbi:MAG: cyclopropane-fatty-acyl-phospholipid synthase family protein [Rhodospirillales bacterium]|nr:cyclopropane-fatty-acyl-phospholipid synthase family protein [Rhodospirillales bacterium]
MLFRNLLRHVVREGTVHLIDAKGRSFSFGDGRQPRCTLRLHSRLLDFKIPLVPSLYFGEAYMDGLMTFEEGSLGDFLRIVMQNNGRLNTHWLVRLGWAIKRQTSRVNRYNPIGKARRNVAHHYDLSDRLYELFLDPDRQYSCAYFTSPHGDLTQAQEDKKRHIAAKLLLDRPGLKVLDVGSGWGGLGLYLCEASSCDVTGITLSSEQLAVSQDRARRAGLDQRVRFRLEDYRRSRGVYDRIVSVGMFEHVGSKSYDEFFGQVRDLLADDGIGLVHSICYSGAPGPDNPFITKYIFPGGHIPSLSEVIPAVERSGLLITDVEILRLHYAETLRIWHDRFQANRDQIAELYDERFCRMWEFYLKGCEMSFRHHNLMVVQIQLAKKLQSVPLTRDYITEWERADREQRAHAAE